MNRNRNYKKTIAAALCVALSAEAVVPAFAAGAIEDKDENVYVNLNQDGSVSGIYVVNEYTLGADTEIVDYGDYSAVKNLSTEDEILLEDGKVTVNAAKGKFLYQGDMADTTLPWLIDISYTLDGKEITAEELPGKSGALKISVSVKDNPASDDEFFDNYLMQATVTLDTEKCSNIRADGATEANVGKDRQILYNCRKNPILMLRKSLILLFRRAVPECILNRLPGIICSPPVLPYGIQHVRIRC